MGVQECARTVVEFSEYIFKELIEIVSFEIFSKMFLATSLFYRGEFVLRKMVLCLLLSWLDSLWHLRYLHRWPRGNNDILSYYLSCIVSSAEYFHPMKKSIFPFFFLLYKISNFSCFGNPLR